MFEVVGVVEGIRLVEGIRVGKLVEVIRGLRWLGRWRLSQDQLYPLHACYPLLHTRLIVEYRGFM